MKTILLVEDDLITAIIETKGLYRQGYNVIHVSKGETAIEIVYCDNIIIDLILMDIDLGDGIDGIETARIILTLKHIPIVFLSSHSEPEIIDETQKISPYGYIAKNIKLAEQFDLIKVILKHIENHQSLVI